MAHINSTEVQTTEGPVVVTKTSTHRDYVEVTAVQFEDGTQAVISWHMTAKAAANYRKSNEARQIADHASIKGGYSTFQLVGLPVTVKLTGRDAKAIVEEVAMDDPEALEALEIQRREEAEVLAHEEREDARKAREEAINEAPVEVRSSNKCRCQCGEVVGAKSFYRPGHDARHASRAAQRLSQGRTENLDPAELNAIVEALPTQALRLKMLAMAHRLDEKAAKKAAKQAK